ncbi:MAG: UDP-N-acetylmuramoyl-tripeptide--D-alanyl-D-alanine ligase [Chloroherpetonaceae bacterium]|nr:UDP-N-acetylmuramoyl-tripeptide--D-alanyl-D-alanine ligase [Chthonomonadaceae bacterium]MDW8208438.1 UDP-N-acetylmuramoyl-tripeptide--D-alanyl-D-alanine ligase [Chloroherpetonaceae bacterium]
MEPMPLVEAAQAVGAQVIGEAHGVIQGVCTDTRRGAQGTLFFALRGEQDDGHRYVAQAFAQGAIAAVVERALPEVTGPLLVVPDTTVALGDLAGFYRRKFRLPVVGITGSVGKTSTKEMIAQALASMRSVLASEKNYNNEIGVPLTLFQLHRHHSVAVIEMGMRGIGQIDRLAAIAEPTIGVITAIGYAHIELLGSREAIAQAKSELLARLPAGGWAVLPRYDPFFAYLQSRVPEGVSVITYGVGEGPEPPDVVARPYTAGQAAILSVRDETVALQLRVSGSHHLHNAAAAVAVAHILEVPLHVAAEALERWQGVEGRMRMVEAAGGWTVLDDCYNAGPESMEAALRTLALMEAQRRVAVLGDMRELGDFALVLHRQVGHRVVECGVNLLITVGDLAAEIGREAERYAHHTGSVAPAVIHFADTATATIAVRDQIQPGDVVLVKGSRAMQMETIVAALTGLEGPAGHA